MKSLVRILKIWLSSSALLASRCEFRFWYEEEDQQEGKKAKANESAEKLCLAYSPVYLALHRVHNYVSHVEGWRLCTFVGVILRGQRCITRVSR